MAIKRRVSGNVRPRPTKYNVRYYDIILDLGVNPETGKRKRIRFKADTADREEAEQMLIVKKAEYLQDELLMPSEMTVRSFLAEYMDDYVRVQDSAATVKCYQEVIDRYLNPEFGDIKLQNLKKSRVQQVYNSWRVKSTASTNPLSATTVHHINRVFKAALNVACELKYIKENPTLRVKIGKDSETEHMDVYTTEEIKKLMKCVEGTDMELPVALLFDCVMRRGELLGLCFEDINYEKGVVTIQHSWVESVDRKNPVLKDCKTDGSYRKIIVSKKTLELLKRQETYCRGICLNEGKRFTGKQRVVCKKDGTPYLPKSFYRKWARTLEKNELRYIKLHGTRHSAISWMLSQGVPLHIVQQRAGHQDPKITLSAYSHVAKDDAGRVAELLENKIFSDKNDTTDNLISIQIDDSNLS